LGFYICESISGMWKKLKSTSVDATLKNGRNGRTGH
jgi:hypothetical protein